MSFLASITTQQPDTITHIGIGGLFAVIVLREVFSFLRNREGNKNNQQEKLNGQETISFQQLIADLSEKVQFKDNCQEIVKRIDGEFRAIERRDEERKEYQDSKFGGLEKGLFEVKSLIKNGHE